MIMLCGWRPRDCVSFIIYQIILISFVETKVFSQYHQHLLAMSKIFLDLQVKLTVLEQTHKTYTHIKHKLTLAKSACTVIILFTKYNLAAKKALWDINQVSTEQKEQGVLLKSNSETRKQQFKDILQKFII